jgi:hypothetical protein
MVGTARPLAVVTGYGPFRPPLDIPALCEFQTSSAILRQVTMSLNLSDGDRSDDNFGALLVAATILSVGVGALWLHTFAGML